MRAVGIDGFGGPEHLKVLDVASPQIDEDGVLIRVRAAGVSYSDVKTRRGDFGKDAKLPLLIGLEVAGVVEKTGAKVSRFSAGDDVYAYLSRAGGYAEFVAEKEQFVARMPKSIDYVRAAAVPLAAIAADSAVELLKLAPGQTVFIAGGGGGVGTFAVQLAKQTGARVVASDRGENEEYVRSLGADEFIDFQKGDVATQVRATHPQGVDGALDAVGGASAAATVKAVRNGGKMIDLGWSGELGGDPSVEVIRFSAEPSGARLERIAELIDREKIVVSVERTFPLDQAARAHELVEARSVRGKLVLTV